MAVNTPQVVSLAFATALPRRHPIEVSAGLGVRAGGSSNLEELTLTEAPLGQNMAVLQGRFADIQAVSVREMCCPAEVQVRPNAAIS